MTRAEQLLESFIKFHKANPQVLSLFIKYTLILISNGRQHYSADAICHRIRWQLDVETQGEPFKINDHHTAFLARTFQAKHPEHRGFFRLRHQPSSEKLERPDALDNNVNADSEIDPELEKVLKEL